MVSKDVDIIGQKRNTLQLQRKEAQRASLPSFGAGSMFRFAFQLSDHVDSLYNRLDELPRRVEHLEKKVGILLKNLEKNKSVSKKEKKKSNQK